MPFLYYWCTLDGFDNTCKIVLTMPVWAIAIQIPVMRAMGEQTSMSMPSDITQW